MKRLLAILSILLLWPGYISGYGTAQTGASPKIIVLRAGQLFDSEKGIFLPARDIIIKENKIEAVGEKLAAPPGAQVIDLKGFTVLPGLIDAHTHLLYLEDPKASLSVEGVKALVFEGTPLRALRGAARAKTFLKAGITTVRDLGNSGRFGDVALRTAIEEGSLEGPRLYVSGPGLCSEGGQFPGLQFNARSIVDDEYRIICGPIDAISAVRENVTYGANLIKIYANNTPNRTMLLVEEMKAIVTEAHLLNVKVCAHATSDLAVARAVEAGVDSIEHGYEIGDATLKLMKEKGVTLVPTDADLVTLKLYFERVKGSPISDHAEILSNLEPLRDRLKRAISAGVTIVAGSDMYVDLGIPQGEGARRVLFAYFDAGMKPVHILQSATIHAANLIGEPRLGVIKSGAFADIIAVEGNPEVDFKAIEQVRFVMKNGQVYVTPGK